MKGSGRRAGTEYERAGNVRPEIEERYLLLVQGELEPGTCAVPDAAAAGRAGTGDNVGNGLLQYRRTGGTAEREAAGVEAWDDGGAFRGGQRAPQAGEECRDGYGERRRGQRADRPDRMALCGR